MLTKTKKTLICLLALLSVSLLAAVAIVGADFLAPNRSVYAETAGFVITVNGGDEQSFADFGEAWNAVKADGVTTATLIMHADFDISNLPSTYGGCLEVWGWELDFDLNGHTLTGTADKVIFSVQDKDGKDGKLTLSDGSVSQTGKITGKKSALMITDGGEAVMNGGTISEISDTGVDLRGSTSKFTMNGGKITGCRTTRSGGGVYADSSTFIMTGGEISGNSSTSAGGIYCYQTKLCVSGAVKITENKIVGSDGTETTVNVKLGNTGRITVAGKLEDAAGNKAQIGVTPFFTYPAINDYSVYYSDVAPSTFFTADEEGKCVGFSGYVKEHKAAASWNSDKNAHYHPCVNDCGVRFDESAHNYVDGACSACGNTASFIVTADGVNTNYDTIEEAWAAANKAGTAAIKMFADADISDKLTVEENKNITLDLNGRKLTYIGTYNFEAITVRGTFTLDDSEKNKAENEKTEHTVVNPADGEKRTVYGGVITGGRHSGVFVSSGGSFTMDGGTIAGNSSTYAGGGVCVFDNGTLTMNNGAIFYNMAAGDRDGGGVNVSGTFNMCGGTISYNTATRQSGGVHVYGTFNVSGNPQISGNKLVVDGKETANNVGLYGVGRSINVNGPLTANAEIYVKDRGAVVVGFTAANRPQNTKPSEIFKSDDTNYNCIYISDESSGTITIGAHNVYNVDFTVDKEPTCTEDGSKSRHCRNCGEKTNITEIGLLPHSYGEWQTTLEPTCTDTGSKNHVCAVCRHKETVEIAALGHTGGAATCCAKAVCTRCGEQYGELGSHEFAAEFTVDKAATCTNKGSKSKHCLHCGEKTEITEMDVLPHFYGEWQTTLEPTCTATGSKKHVCAVCEHEETAEIEIDAAAHSYGNWTQSKAATCTDKGEETRICIHNNEHKETRETAALGHDWGDWAVTKQATVEEYGEEKRVCSHDGAHVETRQLPKRVRQLVEPDKNGNENLVVVSLPKGFTPDIELVVTRIARENYANYQEIAQTVNGEIGQIYDVTLKSNGVTVQPDGTLTIKLRIPENLKGKTFKLFHLHEGEAAEAEYTVDGNYAVITTDRLSEFVFVGEKSAAFNPLWLILIIIMSLVIVGEVTYIVYRKVRKNKATEGKK